MPVPQRKLTMLGNPLADHTGFVCVPRHECEAFEALAAFVKRKLEWNRLVLREVMDPRLDAFLAHFSPLCFSVKRTQTACPRLVLRGTWEDYLRAALGAKKRNALRNYLKRFHSNDRLRITLAQADELEQRIENVLDLWQARWGDKPAEHLEAYRSIFTRCFEHDCLYLATMWHEETPIAARVSFVDRHKGVVSALISGWDRRYADLSPGNTLQAHSIHAATEMGMQVYDFLRGAEKYKYSVFGAKNSHNTSVVVARKRLRSMIKSLITSPRACTDRARVVA
jgi:CelD/BcsL family acetyltransferase involved in cellulose biosynthesis